METRFLLIRHGESLWNAAGRWQGHADPALSERGIAQAEALAARLADEGERADRLISSDLERARHTAEIVGRALALQPEIVPELRELDVGRWEGRTRAQIEARDAALLERFDSGDPRIQAGGGESRADLARRVRRAFRALARESPGARLVVVAHLGVADALQPGCQLEHCGTLRCSSAELELERDPDEAPRA